jgi:hypothetical protein
VGGNLKFGKWQPGEINVKNLQRVMGAPFAHGCDIKM